MASANQYDILMRDILSAINTLPDVLREEGHLLWRSEGSQGVALWADLLPYLHAITSPGDLAAAKEITHLCIQMNTLIEKDATK